MPEDEHFVRPRVIPDTDAAREQAIAAGASHFDTLSFLRPEEGWAPSRRFYGDFYGQLYPSMGFGGEKIGTAIVDLLEGTLFGRFGWADCTAVRFVNLSFDSQVIGISIPVSAFGVEAGSPFLSSIYDVFAKTLTARMSGWKHQPLKVEYSRHKPAPNLCVGSHRYVTQMSRDDIYGKSANDLRRLASERKPHDRPISSSQFCGDTFRFILHEAERAWRSSPASRRRPEWPDFTPVLSVPEDPSNPPTIEGTKCAIKLMEWVRSQEVHEFRQRDALAAVDGVFTRDHGVTQALDVLEQHNVVRSCSRAATSSRGRPSGHWYVVNPKLFSSY